MINIQQAAMDSGDAQDPAALAIAMQAAAVVADIPNTLAVLVAELAKNHARRDEIAGTHNYGAEIEAEDDLLFEVHWLLRERIQKIRAASVGDIKAKARAVEFARLQSPDGHLVGPGSFEELTLSLLDDIAALGT